MGKTYEGIDESLADWLVAQPVFFVSTAPLDADGSVNCSPKGNRDKFAVLGDRRVAYLDQTGSGVETIAHLQENGRIVIVLRFHRAPADRAAAREGSGGVHRRPGLRRPGGSIPRRGGGGCALHHRHRRGPGRRLVWLWRPGDVVRGTSADHGPVVDAEKARRASGPTGPRRTAVTIDGIEGLIPPIGQDY